MEDIIVKDNQSLLDVQLITSGSIEGIMQTCSANNIFITDILSDGQIINTDNLQNEKVVRRYKNRNISPATELRTRDLEESKGIGSMGIDYNFIIS